jgi:prophage regulatory protein
MKFININDVMEMTGIKKTFIYDSIKKGTFPAQVHMGKSALWVKDEILQYMQDKMNERTTNQ